MIFSKMNIKTIAIALFALFILAACQETLEERCAREAKEFTTKQCPLQIDAYTIMDSMTFVPATHTIVYAYTLNGLLDDTTYLNRQNPRQLLLDEIKNSPNLKLYKEAGYSFRYTYTSTKNKGTKLFEATFHEKDYQ